MLAIRTEKLRKAYKSIVAVEGLDLEVEAGEVFGFLGPNGAGKSTTIKLMLGLIKPTAGRAEIFGLDPQESPVEAHRRIAYVPGDVALWPQLTGLETLTLLGNIHGRVDRQYRDELVERFALDLRQHVHAYSTGNRQKLILIAALMVQADLFILDEPTKGLDPLMEQTFKESIRALKERGRTVFLSSHILSEVEDLCDRIAFIRRGNLIETGNLSTIRKHSAVVIDVLFAGDAPDVDHIVGVDVLSRDEGRLSCSVTDGLEEFLVVVGKASPIKLLSREPSLEEMFLSFYSSDSSDA
jgi:ABC-2 type transport system ATP-binding protein